MVLFAFSKRYSNKLVPEITLPWEHKKTSMEQHQILRGRIAACNISLLLQIPLLKNCADYL